MPNDREVSVRSLDLQARARDFRLLDLPGYLEWSRRKLTSGESDAFIAHLDATSMWLLPEDAATINEQIYDDLLDDLKETIEKHGADR